MLLNVLYVCIFMYMHEKIVIIHSYRGLGLQGSGRSRRSETCWSGSHRGSSVWTDVGTCEGSAYLNSVGVDVGTCEGSAYLNSVGVEVGV